ncbi:Phage integrase, N-terminal SAM-like domain [Lentzea fradiae]|uniref:Phage integrase, N-terminal SAM-like domain n=1 Tax=Lentzea fradiae TaxID=200378 RepID=A0A1G8AXK6_9PSEU|nr:phage integrase N-terminal SAM-like domain-containing protein [Lentzea fradiae]SDH25526.1 Phage integrase, N-terminal SAM-like domain [Lentzea fradiae]
MGTTTCTSAAVWDMQAERWRKSLKAQGLSDNTLRGYLYTARGWRKWLETEGYDIEPDDVESFHVDIVDKSSPANAAHHYRNLRVYITWLKKRKQITGGNPFDETEAPKVPDKLTPLLSDEDHAAVLLACRGTDLQALRNMALADFGPALWLSRRTGKPLSINGIKMMLNRLGERAGLADSLHAYRVRMTFYTVGRMQAVVKPD